jgi:hypothetical protein
MTIRPYASAGIALVSTGVLVAALPAITPAPTPPDVTISAQVPKDLSADVALRLSAHDLIDAFFDTGVPGVTQQLLLAIAGGYQPGVDTINAFFDGGVPEVVQAFLIANGDPNSFEAALINGFFDGNPDSDFEYPGIPEPTRLLIQAAIPDGSALEDLVDGFFLNGGAPDVVRQLLTANLDPNSFEAALINGFFNGNGSEYPGIPEPTRLLIQAAIPDGSAAEDLVDAFFLNGGVPGVVQALLPSNALTEAFFAGGAPLVVGAVLLGVTNAVFGEDSIPSGAVNSFFVGYPPPDAVGGAFGPGGVVGLTHFVIDALMGDITPPPTPPAPVAPSAKTFLAAASGPAATAADLPKVSDPIDTDAPSLTLRTASPVNAKASDPEPVAAVAEPAPTATPAVEPAASASDADAGKADDVTDEVKSGNKAEVDPLLLENGGGGASLAKTVQGFRDFVHKLRGGGATDSAKADSTNEETSSPS